MTMVLRPALALFATAGLAACGTPSDTETVDLDTATTKSEAKSMAKQLPMGDFGDIKLGGKIVGPQGPEVRSRLTNEAGAFADITSYVACPPDLEVCDPATAPGHVVYVYVHTVYPGEDNVPSTGSGIGAESSDVERVTRFSMSMPAHGFTGSLGFSETDVIRAVGNRARIIATCVDGGINWTVDAGEGGDQWEQGEPITFWWMSKLPPAGPAEAYAFEAKGVTATGMGPYPAEKEGAPNACAAPSTTPAS